MKNHVAEVHEGKKPHQCPFCELSFGQKKTMQNHIDVKHQDGKKPYKCDFCNATFAAKRYLTTHIKTHYRNGPPKLILSK